MPQPRDRRAPRRRGRGGAARSWLALRLRVPDALAEELAGELSLGTLGAELGPSRHGSRPVSVYVAEPAEPAALLERADRMLAAHGVDRGSAAPRVEQLRDGRWVERYQRSLHPFPLGSRFVVHPGAAEGTSTGRIALRLVPGRAFGTGEHPTTQLCAEALEREVRAGERWVDLGTGSGILAMVAAHCGAAVVEALDVDPEALEVAREVIRANGLESRVRLRVGTAKRLQPACCGGLVANIGASWFRTAAPRLARAVEPGGALIASGFLAPQAAGVERALADAGFAPARRERRGDWCALVLRRAPEAHHDA